MITTQKHLNWLKPSIVLLLVATVLTACAENNRGLSPTQTKAILLVQFRTPTPMMTSENTHWDANPTAPFQPPTVTPTPFYYTVVKGDTFSSIAYRHDVKLSDLIASNPTIDPNFLTIGITLTIPLTGSRKSITLAPTPIPLIISEPNCYPQKDDGLYCLLKVTNNQSYDVENVTAQVTIQTLNNETPVTQLAKSYSNLLETGKSTALIAYFPSPIPWGYQVSSKLITVLPVSMENNRYYEMDLQISTIELSEDHSRAFIAGNIAAPPTNPSLRRVWIIAIAYDSEQNPIGIRKWESSTHLLPGKEIPFDIIIYSFGPKINDVDVFYEAAP